MDSSKYLVLIDQDDRTDELESIHQDGDYFVVLFSNSLTPYKYGNSRVEVRENPTVIDLQGRSILFGTSPILNFKSAVSFQDYTKIEYETGDTEVFRSDLIRIIEKQEDPHPAESLLKYFKAVSEHVKVDEKTGSSFLANTYKKLNYIHQESVLHEYINSNPPKQIKDASSNLIFPFKFNLSQRQALDNALRNNVSVIEGPPGTGKTQTILNIIANLVIQDKKVAVVSGNNAAVQNVLDKLKSNQYHFFAALLGKNENKEDFFSNKPEVDLSVIKQSEIEESELVKEIHNINNRIVHLMELENKKAVIQRELSAYKVEESHFMLYYERQDIEGILKLPFYRSSPEDIIAFMAETHIARARGKQRSIFHKIKLYWKYGFRDFKRMRDQEVDYIIQLQKFYYQLKIEKLEEEIGNIQQQLEREEFSALINKHEILSNQLFQHMLYIKYKGRTLRNMDARSYTKRNNFSEFMDHFPVVLSTTHSIRNCIPDDFLFDYIIIDESSQVDLLTGVLALSCSRNAIIVGDTKQLPQIVDMSIQDSVSEYKVRDEFNYFKHNILSSLFEQYKDTLPNVILKEHYRCHPKIIQFCNQKYYDNELIAFTSENEEDRPLVLCKTPRGNHMRVTTRGSGRGRFNQRELDAVQDLLSNPQGYLVDHSEVGFATPYRKQVNKASDVLDEEIELDTVHKYQGREKSVMIFSTVLDQSWQGRTGISFVDDPCIVNVAVSRARDRFILVTDHSLFERHSVEIGDLIRYMEYNALDDSIIESPIISVFDLLYQEYSEKLLSLQKKLIFISKFKSENIMWTCIKDLMDDEMFRCFEASAQVYLKNLVYDIESFTDAERSYIKRNASADFVVYNKLDKRPVLVIEVDGFASHENNPKQLARDDLKNSILEKHNIPCIRFPTTGSEEREKLRKKLTEVKKYYYG
jgi:superfamily I DNA and/or RNA helicase